MARQLGERLSGRLARVREIRRERGFVVKAITDSLRKPQGKPARVRVDWRRAAWRASESATRGDR
jgi:hypothetical protein